MELSGIKKGERSMTQDKSEITVLAEALNEVIRCELGKRGCGDVCGIHISLFDGTAIPGDPPELVVSVSGDMAYPRQHAGAGDSPRYIKLTVFPKGGYRIPSPEIKPF
jgi:hypothetical protein